MGKTQTCSYVEGEDEGDGEVIMKNVLDRMGPRDRRVELPGLSLGGGVPKLLRWYKPSS